MGKGSKLRGVCTPRAGKLTRSAGKRVSNIEFPRGGGLERNFYATFFVMQLFGKKNYPNFNFFLRENKMDW